MGSYKEIKSEWHSGGREVIVGDTPAMSEETVKFIESIITRDMRILEFGSGGSTIWFAKRAKKVISFEHQKDWYLAVKERLNKRGHNNVSLNLRPRYLYKMKPRIYGRFDIILVDPKARNKDNEIIQSRLLCAKFSYQFLKPGGYLIIDDTRTKISSMARKFMNRLGWKEIMFWNQKSASAWKRPIDE